MRIENCSQLNFGNLRNTMCDEAGDALMRRIGKDGKKISRFADMCSKQETNPVGIEFFFNKGENPNKARLRAEVSVQTPYFTETKQYRQGILTSSMNFFMKMCKKADEMNASREAAEQRYYMFLRKHSIGCGEHSSINALEE